MKLAKDKPRPGRQNRQEHTWRSTVTKKTTDTKKALKEIFVNCRGESEQIPIPPSRCVVVNLYSGLVLKTIDKLVRKRCYCPGLNDRTL